MNLFKHQPWHHLVIAAFDLGLFVALVVLFTKLGLFREIIAYTNVYVCAMFLLIYAYLNIKVNINRIRSFLNEIHSIT